MGSGEGEGDGEWKLMCLFSLGGETLAKIRESDKRPSASSSFSPSAN